MSDASVDNVLEHRTREKKRPERLVDSDPLYQRGHTHDPVSGIELPKYVDFLPIVPGVRNQHGYRLRFSVQLCRQLGLKSKEKNFDDLEDLLESSMYRAVLAADLNPRVGEGGAIRKTPHRRGQGGNNKRSSASMKAAWAEYRALKARNAPMGPEVRFAEKTATWLVRRTFGTGWHYQGSAYSYKDAVALYHRCAKVSDLSEVVGTHPTEVMKNVNKHSSFKLLQRMRAEQEAQEAQEAQEEEEEEEDGSATVAYGLSDEAGERGEEDVPWLEATLGEDMEEEASVEVVGEVVYPRVRLVFVGKR